MPEKIETYATEDGGRVTIPANETVDEQIADFRQLWIGYALAPDKTLDPTALKLKRALRAVVGIDELVAALESLLSIIYPPIGQDENGCLKRGADRPETIRARAVLVKAKPEEVKDNG